MSSVIPPPDQVETAQGFCNFRCSLYFLKYFLCTFLNSTLLHCVISRHANYHFGTGNSHDVMCHSCRTAECDTRSTRVTRVQGHHHGIDWAGHVHITFSRSCSWNWCKSRAKKTKLVQYMRVLLLLCHPPCWNKHNVTRTTGVTHSSGHVHVVMQKWNLGFTYNCASGLSRWIQGPDWKLNCAAHAYWTECPQWLCLFTEKRQTMQHNNTSDDSLPHIHNCSMPIQ